MVEQSNETLPHILYKYWLNNQMKPYHYNLYKYWLNKLMKTYRIFCVSINWTTKWNLTIIFCISVGEWGGEWGKQIGSMDEEPQVRGCYNITRNTTQQKPDKYVLFSSFNYCLTVVLSLEKGAYPADPHVLYCHIKLAFFLTFYTFGSY